jgi:SOS-response transcriptional repressor LexA
MRYMLGDEQQEMTNLTIPSVQLTNRQHQVLAAICDFKAIMGYVPTVRELGQLLHVSSTCTVQRHLDALQRKGYLWRAPGKARSIVVMEGRQFPSYIRA